MALKSGKVGGSAINNNIKCRTSKVACFSHSGSSM